ncbi:alpha/beta-hydrolase [Panus rudis PR-1116 ss-1]|nr:alpha/beta-hydrolase [Panus rudis PR-1116 ss-1]
MTEQTFTLHVPDSEIDYLKQKLELTRFPDELEGGSWDYGVPLAILKRLIARWKDGFDWRASEARINTLPQFTRDIEVEGHGTLNIHYVHKRSELGDNAIPLLFVHGWPGHFMEASRILPLLTAVSPNEPSFHVVAPSLPGYGFSDAPRKPGFAIKQYAEVVHKLMLALGYEKYVTQGGDWGSLITKKLQSMHGGTHFWPPQFTREPWQYLKYLVTPLTQREKDGMTSAQRFQSTHFGFFVEQSTKPQTIGYSLADSPVGLLAWIYEKLVACTDNYPWTDDEVLEWISIYWFSKAGPTASLRIYYETARSGEMSERTPWTNVPNGISRFPKDPLQVPRSWSRLLGNVVFDVEHDRGGHFAAFEVPELLAGDLKKMFGVDGPAFGVVPGKSGYAAS